MAGEVTCKKLLLENDHALLTPLNPSYDPIVVKDEMTILGKVIRVSKRL